MLKEAAGISKIYIACGFTDLRMGIDGLTDLIRERFSLDPLEKGTLFLFCGRKSDRIKAVIYEGDGFLLMYKRLMPGFRYGWPRTAAEARLLSREQYTELMKGFNPLQQGLIGESEARRPG